MKKSVRFILTVASILFFYDGIMAQTNANNQKYDAVIKAHQEKRKYTLSQPETTAKLKPAQTTTTYQLEETDQYQGRKEEFLSLLIVKELPSDFPKYNKSYGVGGYNKVVEDFLATHKNILIESVKRKLESQGK